MSAGPQAALLAEVSWVLVVGATVVFTLTMALLAWVLRRSGRAIDGRRWVLVGAAFPAVVVAVLMGYSWLRSAQLDRPPAGRALVVSVTAHMWWWELRYTDPATGADVVTANELVLPVGRPVALGLTSADVIHAFWVPKLAGKLDMLPGRVEQLHLQVDRAGVYSGVCAEYCGEQHTRMGLRVTALPPAEFDAWLARQAAPMQAVDARGRAVFEAQRCNACHALRGAGDGGGLSRAPDLTHLRERATLGAGTLPNGRDELARWLRDIQRLKSGARMPSYERLSDEETGALAALLLP